MCELSYYYYFVNMPQKGFVLGPIAGGLIGANFGFWSVGCISSILCALCGWATYMGLEDGGRGEGEEGGGRKKRRRGGQIRRRMKRRCSLIFFFFLFFDDDYLRIMILLIIVIYH